MYFCPACDAGFLLRFSFRKGAELTVYTKDVIVKKFHNVAEQLPVGAVIRRFQDGLPLDCCSFCSPNYARSPHLRLIFMPDAPMRRRKLKNVYLDLFVCSGNARKQSSVKIGKAKDDWPSWVVAIAYEM